MNECGLIKIGIPWIKLRRRTHPLARDSDQRFIWAGRRLKRRGLQSRRRKPGRRWGLRGEGRRRLWLPWLIAHARAPKLRLPPLPLRLALCLSAALLPLLLLLLELLLLPTLSNLGLPHLEIAKLNRASPILVTLPLHLRSGEHGIHALRGPEVLVKRAHYPPHLFMPHWAAPCRAPRPALIAFARC
ncbi:MAG: hypothetical protein ACRC56_11875 [Bosea sp. (in: a-proteobacteria)]